MIAYPFSVFKRADRPNYLVSFKDDNGNYLSPLSTKKNNYDEGVLVAIDWLRKGIPQKKEVVKVQDLALKDMVSKMKNPVDVEKVFIEFKKLGLVKSYIINETPQAQEFNKFLTTFWDWETSDYVQEKLRKAHGIHRRHCRTQERAISLYWEEYFNGRYLGEITSGDIDGFIKHMGKMDLSASRKNVVIQAGTKPLRWAFSKGMIEKDPTRGHILYAGEKRKRNILTPSAAGSAFRVTWLCNRALLANILASVTGIRSGEIQALRYQDIGSDCLYIRGSWNKLDGIKLPKNNKTRTVEIPFPQLIVWLVELAKQNPWLDSPDSISPDSFVFWTPARRKVPMHGQAFNQGLREALVKIGFTDGEAKKYEFHGWRHFFTSYMIKILNKRLVKSQTGHLTDVMVDLYGDHETVGDKELIQLKSREIFADLLPEPKKAFVFKKASNQ
jgi:integrase